MSGRDSMRGNSSESLRGTLAQMSFGNGFGGVGSFHVGCKLTLRAICRCTLGQQLLVNERRKEMEARNAYNQANSVNRYEEGCLVRTQAPAITPRVGATALMRMLDIPAGGAVVEGVRVLVDKGTDVRLPRRKEIWLDNKKKSSHSLDLSSEDVRTEDAEMKEQKDKEVRNLSYYLNTAYILQMCKCHIPISCCRRIPNFFTHTSY